LPNKEKLLAEAGVRQIVEHVEPPEVFDATLKPGPVFNNQHIWSKSLFYSNQNFVKSSQEKFLMYLLFTRFVNEEGIFDWGYWTRFYFHHQNQKH